MTDETGYGVLTDAQWAELAPLIEQCRPPHKTEHKNLRRTIEAIIWRHENGAKWRSIPPHLGPWWMAAQTFIRWMRWSPWLGQFGALAKLGSDCCQAANVSVPVAQYASSGVRPASVECGRRAL